MTTCLPALSALQVVAAIKRPHAASFTDLDSMPAAKPAMFKSSKQITSNRDTIRAAVLRAVSRRWLCT